MVVTLAGFVDFAITWRADIYAGATQSSDAAHFGTKGITFRARKAAGEAEFYAAVNALQCSLPKG